MTMLYVVIALVVVAAGATLIAYRWGKQTIRREIAEGKAEDMAHGAEIAAQPHVDRPMSKMIPK